jgi:hypothetical protein
MSGWLPIAFQKMPRDVVWRGQSLEQPGDAVVRNIGGLVAQRGLDESKIEKAGVVDRGRQEGAKIRCIRNDFVS